MNGSAGMNDTDQGPPLPLDIKPEDWQVLRDILRHHIPEREIWAFGSRVQGKARPYSDLDLVILGDEPLEFSRRGALVEALSDSPLPFKIDLIDWATTSPRFRTIIEGQKLLIQASSI